jgi:hypothetical protein
MSSTVLSARVAAINKAHKNLCSHKAYLQEVGGDRQ